MALGAAVGIALECFTRDEITEMVDTALDEGTAFILQIPLADGWPTDDLDEAER
jgi:hypothetical protein